MHRRAFVSMGRLVAVAGLMRLTACASTLPDAPRAAGAAAPRDLESVRAQVYAAERAFAKAMADRDLDAFARLLSDEAVFFSGPKPLHGKAAVLQWWSQYFKTPAAPFSWEPDEVEPLASGTLAHSSGPVREPDGKVVARFNSVWRLEADGAWRVVFDKGSPLAAPRAP